MFISFDHEAFYVSRPKISGESEIACIGSAPFEMTREGFEKAGESLKCGKALKAFKKLRELST